MNKQTINIVQNNIVKGIQKDLNDTIVDEQILTHHRNGMFQTLGGDLIFASIEPATLECITLPYKYNGSVKLRNNNYLIFSSDNIDSEIGIGNIDKCVYTRILNDKCLNFNNFYQITGFLRINSDDEEEIIFVDGYNEDRVINLNNIPYKYTYENDDCKTKKYSNVLDCDELKLNPKISFPCIQISKKNQGNLPDGMYSVGVAYLIDNQRFTDYMSVTTPEAINSKEGDSSLNISLSNLDRNFDYYQIILIGVVNGVTTSKIIGKYPTSQNSVVISDWINENYQDGIPTTELTTYKKNYDKTGLLSANSQYLMRTDIKRKPKINYQKQAFNIKAKYVVYQVPLSYYKIDGKNIGYFRDENYNFVIRHFWNDGEPTEHFQIPCREATSEDKGMATGADVFEINDNKDCKEKIIIENWQVFNTAGELEKVSNEFKCNARILGYGELGYHESTEKYPDNKEIFGEFACTPIRYHRFPDETKVPRYSVINGEIYVNVLGIIFSNIEKPKDVDGKVIENIIGFEILRSERDDSNKTVKSRGIFTNMLGYTDNNNREVAFSNFPFNSLQSNQYLSKTQTYRKQDKEFNFNPLDKVYDNKFTYYTPFGNYFGRERLSNFFQIETEEIGTATGFFEKTFEHPQQKLLTNHSYWVAAAIGFIERTLIIIGKNNKTSATKSGEMLGATGGKYSDVTATDEYKLETVEDLISFDIIGYLSALTKSSIGISTGAANVSKFAKIIKTIKTALTIIASLAVKIPYSILSGAKLASETLKIIKNLSGYQDYTYQYNASVVFNKQVGVEKGNKRRKVLRQPFYLDNGIHSIENLYINNGGRNSSIFVELENKLRFPKTVDNSRNTITGFKIQNNISKKVDTTASVFYVTNKQSNPNQYGTIENTKVVKTHNCIFYFNKKDDITENYSTDEIFGGDCIIYEQSHLNKFPIFRQNLSGANFPPGLEYDYRLYGNVAYPRFWMDSTEFNMDEFFSSLKNILPSKSRLPNQKYNLDGKRTGTDSWIVRDQFMYTSVNGVINYIVEVDSNIAFRDIKQEGDKTNLYSPHYSSNQTNLSYLFRSDLLTKPENFSLDNSYRFLSQTNVFSEQLVKFPKNDIRERNSISYSLPAFNTQKVNNWRYFLPNNYFSFDERDYGIITGIHPLDQDKVIFLFSAASPFISLGRDQLETLNGRNITIGDAGLFSQTPREILHTNNAYGSNHDKLAFNSNQFGHFYISRKQGKIFNFSNNLNEISRDGLHKWCAKYMPLNIESDFPNYPYINNPLNGVGYLLSFDNVFETLYISKRDYKLKDEFKGKILYDEFSNKFILEGLEVKLIEKQYFEDASWTLSYNIANKAFQSYHDWFPDATIQEERHFLSVKDNKLWKHNERCDLYSNYYDVDYPYEIEFGISTKSSVNILQSVEYEQEAYEYRNNCRDRYHNYNETFDRAIVYNSEQSSGMLNLVNTTNNKKTHYTLPKFNLNFSSDIPLVKVENKFRFNEFRDYTDDRGRFTLNQRHLFITKANGYERLLNIPNINYKQKYAPRIRHNVNKIWFSKERPNNINLITKFSNVKLQISSR